MRSSRAGVLAVLAVAAVGLGPVAPPARASCVGPVMAVGSSVDDVQPPTSGGTVVPGQEVTVSGLFFRDGCDDHGSVSGGCTPVEHREVETPLLDVPLVLEQDGRSWVLDTADASGDDDGFAVRWQGRVPPDVVPGPALLRAATTTLPVEVTP